MNIFIFLIFFMLSNKYGLMNANPLLGENVKPASENEYKFIVALVQVNYSSRVEENFFCAGTLISRQHILTADHCLEELTGAQYRILVGSKNLNVAVPMNPLFWINFEQWATVNNHDIDYPENDISTIKLTEPVPSSCPSAVLKSFTDNSDLYGYRTETVGWGTINNNVLPSTLQKVELDIITIEECEDIMYELSGEENPVPELIYFCTKAIPYALFGHGDSGGPLLLQNELIAINKAICPNINFSIQQINAHTSINYYIDFINASLNM